MTKKASLELLYELAIRRLDLLYKMYSNLNHKILQIFKLFASFTPIFLGIGYYLLNTRFTCLSSILLLHSVILYLITILYCLLSTLSQSCTLVNPLEAYKLLHKHETLKVLDSLIQGVGKDYEDLTRTKRNQQRSLRIMNGFIFATLVLMFASYISLFLS